MDWRVRSRRVVPLALDGDDDEGGFAGEKMSASDCTGSASVGGSGVVRFWRSWRG